MTREPKKYERQNTFLKGTIFIWISRIFRFLNLFKRKFTFLGEKNMVTISPFSEQRLFSESPLHQPVVLHNTYYVSSKSLIITEQNEILI